MPLPFVFPASEGPGRLTEIASFKKAPVDSSRLQNVITSAMQATSTFPAFRQCRLGDSVTDNGNTVLIFDWTSAVEKKEFEEDPNNASLKSAMASWAEIIDEKNPSMIRYHITLLGSSVTPQCGYYEVAVLTIDPSQHEVFAASMEKYSNGIGDKVFNYLAVAVSDENPEKLVIIMGYPNTASAEHADKSDQHKEAKKVNDPLVKDWWKSGSHMEQVFKRA
ncbi:hypothetical protein BGZ61DRAFT_486711 [Ilyonectria robusta]|uniref:uncharacterized protein n=1 Tax=Ilyonectria robusta TaxID=1079257 RepID=UPI001E8CE968|nr:uncharacterized protein BGZ61DRAFT_486711 [Ilyonectria robusta]KAH8656283.1 hypothetical protein BGZ61DRAFT_486711 [Ilyonectria robusta]